MVPDAPLQRDPQVRAVARALLGMAMRTQLLVAFSPEVGPRCAALRCAARGLLNSMRQEVARASIAVAASSRAAPDAQSQADDGAAAQEHAASSDSESPANARIVEALLHAMVARFRQVSEENGLS